MSRERAAPSVRALVLQSRFQIGERLVCRRRRARLLRIAAVLGQEALMLVLVAIGAQQFPVAAVTGIVVVVVVAVMHLEQAQIGVGEFPAAATANPGIHLER